MGRDRVEDRLIDRKLQACREHDGAQHADRIFEEPDVGVAYAPDEPSVEIVEAADVVDDRKRADVVEQGVDGKIATERILFRSAVGVVTLDEVIFGAAAPRHGIERRGLWPGGEVGAGNLHFRRQLGCTDVPSERGDLDGFRSELHVREAEAPADDPAVAEKFLDLVRMRRRPDVEVLGPALQQQVADAAAHQVRDVIVFVQPIQDFERVGIDVATRNGVFRARNDGRLRHRREL